jgi:hypothetical protein
MTDRSKGSCSRKMLQSREAAPAMRVKEVIAVLLAEIAWVLPGGANGPGNGMEQKIPPELVLIAALRGGGDINETIHQSRPDRRDACSLGDGRIRDAARPCKRDCQ